MTGRRFTGDGEGVLKDDDSTDENEVDSSSSLEKLSSTLRSSSSLG